MLWKWIGIGHSSCGQRQIIKQSVYINIIFMAQAYGAKYLNLEFPQELKLWYCDRFLLKKHNNINLSKKQFSSAQPDYILLFYAIGLILFSQHLTLIEKNQPTKMLYFCFCECCGPTTTFCWMHCISIFACWKYCKSHIFKFKIISMP